MELKEKIVPALYPQVYTVLGSYWSYWQCRIKPPSSNVHLQTLFYFLLEAISEDDGFFLHPDRLDLYREIQQLQTRLWETKA